MHVLYDTKCMQQNIPPRLTGKNYDEYTMICVHYLVWSIVLEIRNGKKSNAEKFWAKTYNNEQWVEKNWSDNG